VDAIYYCRNTLAGKIDKRGGSRIFADETGVDKENDLDCNRIFIYGFILVTG
jgi:hypothetical protein